MNHHVQRVTTQSTLTVSRELTMFNAVAW